MRSGNPLRVLYSPDSHWRGLSELPLNRFPSLLVSPFILAFIPSIAWYYGITEVGWRVGDGEPVRLSSESALPIIVLFYAAMMVSLGIIGYLTHWMSKTYGAETTIAKGIAIVGHVATPLFISGVVGFYPVLWLDLLIGIVAVSWAVYLLYTGIPLAMKLSSEQGFLYASAVAGVCLVILICIMVSSVILWDFGFAPVFVD